MTERAPQGWHDDPERPGWLRYWTGSAWTEQRKPSRTPPRPGRFMAWLGVIESSLMLLFWIGVAIVFVVVVTQN